MTRRAIRAQRKAKEEMRGAQYEALGRLVQNEELGLYDDAPFTLPDGTEITPATPWPSVADMERTK